MSKEVQRNFIIGDQWLYYKIYSGPKTTDKILTDIVKPVTEKLLSQGIIEKWFFIRYADPKHHLRLRFQYADPNQVGVIINTMYPYLRAFTEEDFIWKVQIDTYQREVERYGAATMELSETLFYHDSKMIIGFLDLVEGDEGDELRWLFSLRSMGSFLNSFHFSDPDKMELLNVLRIGFKNEFDTTNVLSKQINDKFRGVRSKVEDFMSCDEKSHPDYLPILVVIKEKEKALIPIVSQILEIHKKGLLMLDLDKLMASYLHMLMNRLFRSNNRLYEAVCYDFLNRYYRSKIAREKSKASI